MSAYIAANHLGMAVGFLIGCIVAGPFGFLIGYVLAAASNESRREEREWIRYAAPNPIADVSFTAPEAGGPQRNLDG